MSTFKGIDCLPLETQQMVLRAMSDIKTLVVTIHASPLMRRAFDSYSNPILGEVLVMNTMKSAADVFPLAVALNHLTTKFSSNQAASDPPGYNQKITNFCRSYLKNLHTFSIVDAGLSLKMAMNIESTYLRMVDIAQQFGMYVCDCAKIERGVSISESQRFLKAVYIYELARVLFRTRIMNEDGTEYSTALHTFWTSFAPWEAAQVQAFERFLQKLLVDKVCNTPIQRFASDIIGDTLDDLKDPNLESIVYLCNRYNLIMLPLQHGVDVVYGLLRSDAITPEFLQSLVRLATNPEFSNLRKHMFSLNNSATRRVWFKYGDVNMKEALKIVAKYPFDEGPRDFWFWAQIWAVDQASTHYRVRRIWSGQFLTIDDMGACIHPHSFWDRDRFADLALPTMEKLIDHARSLVAIKH